MTGRKCIWFLVNWCLVGEEKLFIAIELCWLKFWHIPATISKIISKSDSVYVYRFDWRHELSCPAVQLSCCLMSSIYSFDINALHEFQLEWMDMCIYSSLPNKRGRGRLFFNWPLRAIFEPTPFIDFSNSIFQNCVFF